MRQVQSAEMWGKSAFVLIKKLKQYRLIIIVCFDREKNGNKQKIKLNKAHSDTPSMQEVQI